MSCPFLVAVVTFNRFLVLLFIGMSIVPPPPSSSLDDSGKSVPVSVVVESADEGDTFPSPAPSFPEDSKPVILMSNLLLFIKSKILLYSSLFCFSDSINR